MKVKVDIDTRVFIRFVLVFLGSALALYAVYRTRTALTLIGVSLFLTLALNPPVAMLSRRLPGSSRVAATALAYLAVLVILAGFFVLIVPPVIEQSSKFADTVPSLIDQADSNRYLIDDFITRYNLETAVDDAVVSAKKQAADVAANLGNVLVGGVGTILGGLANAAFVLVLTFLMLIEGPTWLRKIWGLYDDPDKLERHKNLVHRMYRVVTGFVNGQLAVAAIAATATLIVLLSLSATLGLPANLAVPLAVIVFFGGMIPMVGSTIGAILVALILLLNSFTAMVIFLIFFLIYQQIENNFIAPTIQAKNVELSALAILAAILIGVNLYGILGGILAIPVAGCLRVILLDHLEYAGKRRKLLDRVTKKSVKQKTA